MQKNHFPTKKTVHQLLVFAHLLLILALLLTGCETGSASNPSTDLPPTGRPTFTPLVVKTASPLQTETALPVSPIPPSLSGQILPTPLPLAKHSFQPERPLHFILVQHARCAWDEFWCPVEQGINDAARELGVSVTILSPEKLDLHKTAAQIDEAVAARPDGIALTVSDPVLLREAILRATASGLPVIAYNAGSGPIQDKLPYLTYLGPDNYQSGYLGGRRLIEAGATAGVCINHAPGLTFLQIRCRGFQEAFTEKGLLAETLDTTSDLPKAKQDIQTYLQAHPQVNAALTNGPLSASSFYAYLKTGRTQPGKFFHGTFDLTPEITAQIENGTTLFGIDQQPYLQGYEAVFWLTLITRYGLKPAQPVMATGPRFVDQNALTVQSNPAQPIHLYLVHHGLCEWDPYWCVIDQGAQDAARNMQVQLTILGPKSFDLHSMALQIDEAVEAQPSGLIVTIPDAHTLRDPILRAINTGLPVIAIDSGFGPIKDNLPYLTYVGQDEFQAGYLGAQRLIEAGAREGVCVIQQKGQAALEARCQGFIEAFRHKGLKADSLDCGGNPQEALELVQRYAQAHPQLNAYLTLSANDPGAVTFYEFLKATGRKPGELLHGTFDLSPQVADAIEDGTTLFTIDAQPYLQGYSTVMYLTLLLRQNIWPVSPLTSSGPAFVDQSNLALVKSLAGKYR
jgi:simple sugar transport system substrate-binding protein